MRDNAERNTKES